MTILQEMQKRARHILPAAIFAMVIGYFTYHTVQGDKGIHSYLKLNQQLRVAQSELAETQDIKETLERKVRGLRHTSLDLDLLEERARSVLNLMRDDELLIHFHR
ncbi:MAG: septum formation initiator [Rhodospirillaceae bacterium]|nr:septum formation initiator [Rhodospirillaceae bacterium]|tara:strand:- start:257 stop:571 length:315 start_codon:yes stop_codon:yes gene_type:complete